MDAVWRTVRAAPTLARVSVARHVAYRAEMTIWILTAILPLIMLALWDAVATDGPIADYDRSDVARYFVAALVVRQLTGAWVIWELSHQIRTGALSAHLLRPLHPLVNQGAWMLTAMPFRLAILAPLVAIVVLARPDLVAVPSAAHLALFVPSVLLAWLLSFLVQCAFGLMAFWVDKTDGLFGVWQAVWALLSGYVAPLAFFPAAWGAALRWMPFQATLATPVELLGGFVTPADALPLIGAQVLWCAAAWGLVVVLWRRGLARYGAFGA